MDKEAKKALKNTHLDGNRKHRPRKMTYEERKKNYEEYLVFKSSYPKGQLCSFFLRGSCWLKSEECQFAHGVSDLNIENYKRFAEDHLKKQIKNHKEYAYNIQKYYMLVIFRGKDYSPLYYYQEELRKKGKIDFFFPLEVVNMDQRKRTQIRRIFHKEIFDEFCFFFFNKMFKDELISIDRFEHFYEALGFIYNFRKFSSQKLLTKTVIDRKTKVKKSIIKLMPNPEEMMQGFEKVVLEKLRLELTMETKDKILPFTAQYISSLISKNIDFDKALVHHYCKVKGVSLSEFLEDLFNRNNFTNDLKSIFENVGIPFPEKEQLIHVQNNEELITDFKETFWEKFFTTSEAKFGFLSFQFIRDNYIKRFLEDKRFGFIENALVLMIKKAITLDKNLFFINNNNSLTIFNLNKFDSFDLEDFEEFYEQRCEISDVDAQRIYNQISDEDEVDLIKLLKQEKDFEEFFKLANEDKVVKQFGSLERIYIDDRDSFLYFLVKSIEFEVVAVDLEGTLNKISEIDLIQINNGSQTFIIDYHKINNITKDELLKNLIKITLTYVLETQDIEKIFHDGRNDCLALHSTFKICTSNYLDLGNIYTAIKQFKYQIDFIEKFKTISDTKSEFEYVNMLSFVGNSNNPGLNRILEEYDTKKRTNIYKEKFHKMFGVDNNRENFFLKRPIDEEWLTYCELDVKFMIETTKNMIKDLEALLKKFYGKHLKQDEMKLVVRLLSVGHLKYSCEVMR